MNMNKREKVINGLRSIKTYLASQAIETTDSFAREGFIESQKDIDDALALLKDQEPVPPEMEGGGFSWYPVCGACHGVIGDMDSYCKHCGTPVLKEKAKPHHNKGGVEIEETE